MNQASLSRFWLVWLFLALWASWHGFLWQLEYLRSHGPNFYWAFLASLFALPLLLLFWHDVRRLGAHRYEARIVVVLPILMSLIFEPKATAMVLATALACFALGRRAVNVLGLRLESTSEEIGLSLGAGLGILHVLLFILGSLRWYYPAEFAGIILLPLTLFWREARLVPGLFRRMGRTWNAVPEIQGWAGTVLSAFAVVLLVPAVLVVLAPSVSFDMLRVHLPAVAFNVAHHGLLVPPFLEYAYFPQSVESVMTMGYAMAGQAAAQLIPLLYLGAALCTLFRLGRVMDFDVFQSCAGVLASLAVPAFHWTAAVGKNDFALALFLLLSLLAFLRWREAGDFRWIYLGAFFIAMAAGVKHISFFAMPPLAVLYLYAALRQPGRLRALANLAAIVLIFGSFWYLRAWMATGNPVFPARTGYAVQNGAVYFGSWWKDIALPYLRYPWQVNFHGKPYFESVSDYPIGIITFMFLPVWLLLRSALTPAAKICLFFCAVYLIYWLKAVAVVRFAIGPISLLLLFTAALTIVFVRQSSKPVRLTVLAAAIYTLLFSACGILINEVNGPQISYFTFRIAKEEYLRQVLSPYRSMEFIKRNSDPQDRVLSVGSCALAYAPNPATFDCPLPVDSTLENGLNVTNQGNYQFLILPTTVKLEVPSVWRSAYADSDFTVYKHLPQ